MMTKTDEQAPAVGLLIAIKNQLLDISHTLMVLNNNIAVQRYAIDSAQRLLGDLQRSLTAERQVRPGDRVVFVKHCESALGYVRKAGQRALVCSVWPEHGEVELIDVSWDDDDGGTFCSVPVSAVERVSQA